MPRKNFKRVVITGGSSGIGRGLAYEFANAGAEVVLLSRNEEALSEITNEMNEQGGTCHWRRCDVSILDDVNEGIQFAADTMGGIDLGILNSGIGEPEWLAEFDVERFKRVFSVNLFGIAHGLKALVPLMREQGHGTIAGVSSIADVRGYPGSASYCTSKAAASTLLESARVELKEYGIHVVTVRPGFVRTPMTDKNEFHMPFLWEVDKAASVIRNKLERGKRIVQFPWPIVTMTRLIGILPNWLFEHMATKARHQKK